MENCLDYIKGGAYVESDLSGVLKIKKFWKEILKMEDELEVI